jgi:hypothetical protein
MPAFDFPSLLWWGLPLAAAPVVIHLINLLRHRTVRWPAMEFLLASQRKYRTRVLLKQLLLMLLRIAAIAGVVLALAQPRWRSALAGLLGGERTTHLLLFDDSFSMSQREAEDDCFDRARRAAVGLLDDLLATGGGDSIAIGRFSALATTAAERGFDLEPSPLTAETASAAKRTVTEATVSQKAVGPRDAIAAAAEYCEAGSGGRQVLWVLSDFRSRNWKVADDTAEILRRVSAADAEIRLVDCGGPAGESSPRGNLGIESLETIGGVPAAGVVLPFEITVRNHGSLPARGVLVDLREDGLDRPGVRLEAIPAGSTASRRFNVRFAEEGDHLLEASLPADSVAADNLRSAAVRISESRNVLVVDGASIPGSRGGDAFYIASALSPGTAASTGLDVRIEPRTSLATLPLDSFDTIWLVDVTSLDRQEMASLEAFVRGGGGAVFFTGPRTDVQAFNRTAYREGRGLFPFPLAGPVELLPSSGERKPDVLVEPHPVVSVLAGRRNPLIDAVRVSRVMAVDRTFEPDEGSGLRRLLSLRTGMPLLVEQPFGEGLVAVMLSTAAPEWNSWARGNPSWVVVMLELESHLARGRRAGSSGTVGDPIRIELEPGIDEIEVDFSVPPEGTLVRVTAETGEGGRLAATLEQTPAAGGYFARWRRRDGLERERLEAINVDPAEGDLERIDREGLERSLAGVPFIFEQASQLERDSGSQAGTPLLAPLLAVLVLVLLAEQALAYSASYHPVRRGASPR